MVKVLVVDDDVDFVETTKTLLETSDYEVLTAHEGRTAKKLALEHMPDAIILDVMMTTKTEGFDVARELRSKSETRKIPIIMLTAVNQEMPWRFGPDDVWLPVDEFIEKPVRPELLLAAVRRAIENRNNNKEEN